MVDRVRRWIRRDTDELIRPQHMTRREKELRQRRLLFIGTGIAAGVVVVALLIGAVYQYVIFPNQAFATVNGEKISREDYVKYRKFTLLQETAQVTEQLQSAAPDQQAQLQQTLQGISEEYADLEDGNAPIDPVTLRDMVNNTLAVQGLSEFGLTISDEELNAYVTEILLQIDLEEPTPIPTTNPTAAAWATETSEIRLEEATTTAIANQTAAIETREAFEATQEADASATVEAGGTPPPTATATEEPTETPTLAPTLDPDAPTPTLDPDEPTPTEVPTATQTPSEAEIFATGEEVFGQLEENFLDAAGMSKSDFERLVAEPALAQQMITEQLTAEVTDTAEQVRASHILVQTLDAAQELVDGRLQTEDFATVAEEVSIDESSAVNGGDLGWFPRGIMDPAFEEAAFDMEVGEISEPVLSQFGWHVIMKTGHEQDRPLTVEMLNQVKAGLYANWLRVTKENSDIETDVPLPPDGFDSGIQQAT